MKKDRAVALYALSRAIAKARARAYALELFCPKDFHHYEGVDVCLSFCRKKACRVLKALKSEKGEG